MINIKKLERKLPKIKAKLEESKIEPIYGDCLWVAIAFAELFDPTGEFVTIRCSLEEGSLPIGHCGVIWKDKFIDAGAITEKTDPYATVRLLEFVPTDEPEKATYEDMTIESAKLLEWDFDRDKVDLIKKIIEDQL